MSGEQEALERSQLKALEASLRAPHDPAIDRALFRLSPWLRENASPTAVREALETLVLHVLRKDRLLRGAGTVPPSAGTGTDATPLESPRAAIEPQPSSERWPSRRSGP